MGSKARRNISRDKGLREEKKRKRVRKSKVRDERSTWGKRKETLRKRGIEWTEKGQKKGQTSENGCLG